MLSTEIRSRKVHRANDQSEGSESEKSPFGRDRRAEKLLLHAHPTHTHCMPSPLSKESPDQNYRGFLHLTILLLVVSMSRLVLENFRKYGFLISIPGQDIPLSDLKYAGMALTFLVGSILIAFGSEWFLAVGTLQTVSLNSLAYVAMVSNIVGLVFAPAYIVWTHMYHPLLSMIALLVSLILCMKVISYHLVNAELRQIKTVASIPYKVAYPGNITLRNFLYFWVAPTLCYQPSYPRTVHIRPKFILKRMLEFAACLTVIHLLTEQYARPTVQNSIKLLNELDWLGILERLLKLSVCSLYIWLLLFYAIFHSFPNMMAELLRFGDRSFYQAWWNAKSIEDYWRLWNGPVHQWLKRHIYLPLVARGWSSRQAQMACFSLSAIAHEYLVAVPTHILQAWALTGMMMQIPLISLTNWYMKRHPESSFGNYFFWIVFCIFGQPMCVLLYYHAWATKTSSAVIFSMQL